ncbi:MAG: sigma-54-dependent transcriptional regulator [Burkholderiales bacterium]
MQALAPQSRGKILIVDDDEVVCKAVERALDDLGFAIDASTDPIAALEAVRKASYDLVICDIKMPGMDGMTLLERIKEYDPSILVVMMTGHASIESAVEAMKKGAQEYIAKPFPPAEIRLLVERAFERRRLVEENLYLKTELKQLEGGDVVVGASPEMQHVFELAMTVAKTDSSVLITGESGTGKEIIARIMHFHGPRANAPFVTVNCSAIPEHLLESELFGHKKGAFTGALYSKRGSFELAHGGTFFLDEIGDMQLSLQAKILRVLEEKKVKKVGAEEAISVDTRVIAATNKDLAVEIREGRFREDLYYRLNIVQIAIPPLREHKVDIAVLARQFLNRFSTDMNKPLSDYSPGALDLMMRYDWPGNIRELKNAIERAVIFAVPGEPIRMNHLPPQILAAAGQPARVVPGEFQSLKAMELDYIKQVLEACGGNKARASEILKISPSTIWRKLVGEDS